MVLFLTACASNSPAPVPTTATTCAPTTAPVSAPASAPMSSAAATATATAHATATPPKKHAQKPSLKRIELARGIKDKEPLEPDTSFNAKESRVYAFLEIENPEKLPGEVSIAFEPPNGKPQGDVKLAIGEGARWRTWAFTRQAHEAGKWTAIVRDEEGREIGRQSFDVKL